MGHDRPANSAALAALWDARYAASENVWSGRVNPRLVSELTDASSGEPLVARAGNALDAGCGEGADSLWLAAHGWTVLGVDLSSVAVAKASSAAATQGLGERTRFAQRDLSTTPPPVKERVAVTRDGVAAVAHDIVLRAVR